MISTRSCWAVICMYCSRVGVARFPTVWLPDVREPHACNPVAYEPVPCELDEPDVCEADEQGACEPNDASCGPSCEHGGHCSVHCDPLPLRLLPPEALHPHPVLGGPAEPVGQDAPSGGPLRLPLPC
jgi:hypothetical protein